MQGHFSTILIKQSNDEISLTSQSMNSKITYPNLGTTNKYMLSSKSSYQTARDRLGTPDSEGQHFERSTFDINFILILVCQQNAHKFRIDERQDVYNLVGIVCDDLFQKDENEKSVMFYFDGDKWVHEKER